MTSYGISINYLLLRISGHLWLGLECCLLVCAALGFMVNLAVVITICVTICEPCCIPLVTLNCRSTKTQREPLETLTLFFAFLQSTAFVSPSIHTTAYKNCNTPQYGMKLGPPHRHSFYQSPYSAETIQRSSSSAQNVDSTPRVMITKHSIL